MRRVCATVAAVQGWRRVRERTGGADVGGGALVLLLMLHHRRWLRQTLLTAGALVAHSLCPTAIHRGGIARHVHVTYALNRLWRRRPVT